MGHDVNINHKYFVSHFILKIFLKGCHVWMLDNKVTKPSSHVKSISLISVWRTCSVIVVKHEPGPWTPWRTIRDLHMLELWHRHRWHKISDLTKQCWVKKTREDLSYRLWLLVLWICFRTKSINIKRFRTKILSINQRSQTKLMMTFSH